MSRTGDINELANVFFRSRYFRFICCYLLVSLLNAPLLYLYWLTDDGIPLLSLGWPFYLASIVAQLLAPHPVRHNGMTVPVHDSVFYAIMLVAFIAVTSYIAARGLKAERRKRGLGVLIAMLLLQANVAFAILNAS